MSVVVIWLNGQPMTIFELAIGLSVLTAAVSGVVAGSDVGILSAVAGLVVGGLIGLAGSMLPVLLLARLTLWLARPKSGDSGAATESVHRPDSHRWTPLLLVVLLPVLCAPVWTAYLAYRAVAWVFVAG